MSDTVKPVWVWLPAQAHPVRCGTFSLLRGVGTFHYDDEYLARPGAQQLDEFSCPGTISRRIDLRERAKTNLYIFITTGKIVVEAITGLTQRVHGITEVETENLGILISKMLGHHQIQ